MKSLISFPILLAMMWYDMSFYIIIPSVIIVVKYVFAPVLDYCRK